MTMTRPTTEQITHKGQLLSDVLGPAVVNPSDFGAVGDGVADDTAALKAAFDYAIPARLTVVLRGHYRVTGPINTQTLIQSGDLKIYCDGQVSITVDPASTAFFALFRHITLAAHTVSITGEALLVDLSDRCANGFWIYYFNRENGGIISITAPVTIRNVFAQAGILQETSGFLATGAGTSPYGFGYSRVLIDGMTVESVQRSGSGQGRGIGVQYYTGDVEIRNCRVSNPQHSTLNEEFNGIACFGALTEDPGGLVYKKRLGRSVISDCTLIDCYTRSIKIQCSDCTVVRPRIFRKDIVSWTSTDDIDFQYGNGTLIDPYFQFDLNGSTSPLGPTYNCVTFRNWLTDSSSTSTCVNAVISTEVPVPRIVKTDTTPNMKAGSVVVENVVVVPRGSATLTSTPLVSGPIAQIGLTHTTTANQPMSVAVRNCSGRLGLCVIGYAEYDGGPIASLLRVEAIGNRSSVLGTNCFLRTGGPGPSIIESLDSFVFKDNHNFPALFTTNITVGYPMKSVDLTKLEVGNIIVLDLDSIASGGGTVTGAPPWDTSSGSTATVEVLGQGRASINNEKVIRVVNTVTPSGSPRRSQVFVSVDNAATWIREDDAAPVTVTADSTIGAWESAVINNKSGSACVITLPSASLNVGRRIVIKTIQAQAVNSASSNVVPLAGGSAGTAIVTGTAGKFAELVSDGTNWIIMSAN